MNPYVFIVGCPRSGTTLLQRMVDAHPDIAITRQSRCIPNYYEKRKGLTPEGLVTPELVDRLVEERRFKNLEIGREELESLAGSGKQVPFESFVTGIFNHYGAVQGKRLVGDKTPRYVRSIPTLHDLWPETKFVHLIRDGRDVFLSMMNWKKARQLRRPILRLEGGSGIHGGALVGAERTSGPPGRWIAGPRALPRGPLRRVGLRT